MSFEMWKTYFWSLSCKWKFVKKYKGTPENIGGINSFLCLAVTSEIILHMLNMELTFENALTCSLFLNPKSVSVGHKREITLCTNVTN